MNILFVSPSYKPAYIYGGPAVSVSELAEALVLVGHNVTVYTTTANGKQELDVQTGIPVLLNGVNVSYFKRQTGDHTHISFGLWQKLWKTANLFDIIHLQSWWSFLILGAAAICKVKKCPYIISPRGMLSTYSFEKQHSFFKKAIHQLLGKSLLKTSKLHATTSLEWNDCLMVNSKWKGFILPNIIRFPTDAESIGSIQTQTDVITFGFLSRIDPKKGLELFMQALSKVKYNYHFKIAGTGDEQYISSLKNLATALGIESKVEWCGWKNGEEKFEFLQSIDVFILTSYNENFANVVIESLLIGTPVFLSEGVGLAEYVKGTNFGWVSETNVISITKTLEDINLQRHQLAYIKSKAPAIIRKDFGKELLAKRYSDAYVQFS